MVCGPIWICICLGLCVSYACINIYLFLWLFLCNVSLCAFASGFFLM